MSVDVEFEVDERPLVMVIFVEYSWVRSGVIIPGRIAAGKQGDLLDRPDRSGFDRVEDGVQRGKERFTLLEDIIRSAHRRTDAVVDRLNRARRTRGRCLRRFDGDQDRRNSDGFDGTLNMHDRAMTERSTPGQEDEVRRDRKSVV